MTGVAITVIATGNANTLWTRPGTKVSLGRQMAARAVAEHRDKLDLDGCLVRFSSQPTNEKTGAISMSRTEDGLALFFNAMVCEVVILPLTSDRLMGVKSRADSACRQAGDGCEVAYLDDEPG